jgi:sRNA-binding protein
MTSAGASSGIRGPVVNRRAKIERNIAAFVAAFPLAFATDPEQIKPLSIGIKQRIYARCTLSHREVSDALRRYTGRVAYLHAIVEGAVRIDLDGTASGNVAATEATHAAGQMKRILAIANGKPKDKIKPNAPAMPNVRLLPAMPDAPSPSPRRLGLADLKQAGAARRIAREEVAPDV